MPLLHIALPAVIVPGLSGSEPEHWQSRFEAALPRALRVTGVDWYHPSLSTWTDGLLRAAEQQPNSILIAHSLGCALVAHVAARHPYLPVAGAMLVAPADVDASPAIPDWLGSFASVPLRPLPFPSVVVASSNDPYMTARRARTFASAWGARLINVGACGHINVASGFGHWPEGQRILKHFAGRLAAPLSPAPAHLSPQPERT